ncbi:uncharacterized protein LOC133800401 [Humulus lupulus]|uniref:uncharacterized protein LOC133800401 n=1 Tax=Humulus lupulus TaxID=3486 RepID=UPI002B4096AA|nr:uncharacterized protein LOC133800401 [Humulus lupulus]
MASSSNVVEDLEASWGGLQIAEEEEQGLFFQETPDVEDEDGIDARWCLVGKLLGDRVADFDTLRNVLASLWRPVKGMYVKQLETNKFLFQFFHEIDINRVMEGTPWTFNRTPVILERLKLGENPRVVPLNTMEIWVQVYNLKVGFMSDRVLKACGDFIGMFILSCPKNYTGIWREFLRVRVRINIDQPLKRRMKIQYSKGDFFWAEFKYERLPTFCFICGVLGHSEKFCIKLFAEEPENIVRPYGLFMHAPDRRQGKQIGARWLRDNMARPLTGNHEGSSPAVTTNAGGDNERLIRDTQMREAGMRGSNYANEGVTPGGIRGVDRDLIYRDRGDVTSKTRGIGKDLGGRVEGEINGVTVDQITDINEGGIGCQNEGFMFLDPKRRRVNLGLEQGLCVGQSEAMELGRDEDVGERVRVGLENRAELQTQNKEAVLDPISENGGKSSEVGIFQKNVEEAGSSVWARLEL